MYFSKIQKIIEQYKDGLLSGAEANQAILRIATDNHKRLAKDAAITLLALEYDVDPALESICKEDTK